MKTEIIKQYVDEICQRFELTRDEFFSKTKERRITDARQMFFYLCIERNMSLKFVENYMTKHGLTTASTTILHHSVQMKRKIEDDKDIKKIVKNIARCVS